MATRDAQPGRVRACLTAMTCALKVLIRAFYAGKSGDRVNCVAEFMEKGMLSMWASAKVRECHSREEHEDKSMILRCAGYFAEEHGLP